ncbi:hypothetical protein ABZW30_34955 [Kitasatospora sp. NPDC004669]|uniref:hypothetical protein n=1 Tax=Kitasatospora sp. NPDC004669 TaxID=3154555 RepID=UPI0033BA1B5F
MEVVDGFHADPDRVRHVVTGAEWTPLSGAVGAGALRTRQCFPTTEATAGLTALLGREPEFDAGADAFGFYTFVSAGSAAHTEADTARANWAAVLYLTPPHLCSGGISFLRDAETEAPEITMHVPIRFNRLVLFRPNRVPHRASAGFGTDPLNGRLTQVFLFN